MFLFISFYFILFFIHLVPKPGTSLVSFLFLLSIQYPDEDGS